MLGNHEETYPIREDVVDPSGVSGLRGAECTLPLDGAKLEVPMRWRDRITTMDVHELDGQFSVILYCPQCARGLKIDSNKKRIRFQRSPPALFSDEKRGVGCSYGDCDWRGHLQGDVIHEVR